MTRVILVTFGFMGWAFWEMSGGSGFVPGDNGVVAFAPFEPTQTDAAPEAMVASARSADPVPQVSRADTVSAGLNSIVTPKFAAASVVPASVSDDVVRPRLRPEPRPEPRKVATFDVSEPELTDDMTAGASDLREVLGNRVNLRGGPGTAYAVLTQLLRGERVEILDDTGDGWVKLRALDGDNIGWMSEDFLAVSN